MTGILSRQPQTVPEKLKVKIIYVTVLRKWNTQWSRNKYVKASSKIWSGNVASDWVDLLTAFHCGTSFNIFEITVKCLLSSSQICHSTRLIENHQVNSCCNSLPRWFSQKPATFFSSAPMVVTNTYMLMTPKSISPAPTSPPSSRPVFPPAYWTSPPGCPTGTSNSTCLKCNSFSISFSPPPTCFFFCSP